MPDDDEIDPLTAHVLRMTDARPWDQRYPEVDRYARKILCRLDASIHTKGLLELMWPPRCRECLPAETQKRALQRLFHAVQQCAEHSLSDCVTKGNPERIMGKLGRRNIWGRPDPTKARLSVTHADISRRLAALDSDPTFRDEAALSAIVADARTLTEAGKAKL